MKRSAKVCIALALVLSVGFETRALAQSPYEYAGQGSEALGRGGAWVARASDAMAISRNPAGIVGQRDRLGFGYDFAIRQLCFSRVKAAGDLTEDVTPAGGVYPRVCDTGVTIPAGHLAFTHSISSRLAIGGGVLTPSGVPRIELPSFVLGGGGMPVPSPQRYLLLDSTSLMAIPTASIAYAPLPSVPSLRLGVSLGWGIAWIRTTAAAPGVIEGSIRPADNDVKVRISALDAFVPRVTFGAHWSASSYVDVGAAFTWSDSISARGDATTEANAFTPRVANGDTSKIARGDTSRRDCGRAGSTACGDGGNAQLIVPIPITASLGTRVRLPRRGTTSNEQHRLDPIESDVFDLEFDVTYAQASTIDRVGARFPEEPKIPFVGTAGTFPSNNDSLRRYKDTITFHLGSDVVVVPRRLSVRAGSFLQSASAIPGFVGLETFAGNRVGFSAGLTARIPNIAGTSSSKRGDALDVSLAYMHMIVSDISTGPVNDENAPPGIPAAAGSAPFRTPWPVSLGRIETALDVLHLGASYRF